LFARFGYASASEQGWSVGKANTNLETGSILGGRSINDQLIALSQPLSAAFIAKKEFIIDVDSKIPEPSTLALAGAAFCGLGISRSRRRG